MTVVGTPTHSDAIVRSRPSGLTKAVCSKLSTFCLRRSALWKEIQCFGRWLESDAAKVADEANQSTILIELGSNGTVEALRIGRRKHPHVLDGYQRLWDFLYSLGVRRLKLDERLESNQIEDIFALLYSHRRRLQKRDSSRANHGAVRRLLSEEGVHIACTNTFIRGETLSISYSYCVTQFSRLVRWFEQKNRTFSDHRALFYAAPRYALLVGLVAACPGVIFAWLHGDWYLLVISGLVALALTGLLYLFLMVIGSVEYDNEEKAYRLGRAYGELKSYTARIQADISKARIIQERFLPDSMNMPFPEQINWACSFVPAEQVGGDYFDVCVLDDTRAAILFSDVSGHGMSAAFLTAILKTTFRAWTNDSEKSLTELVRQLNLALCGLAPDDSFAAAFVGIYDASTGEFCYVNAGHHPEPWRIPAKNDEPICSLSDARAMILGVQEDVVIGSSRQTLEPGEIILFVSDGIIENRDADGELYGADKFERFVSSNRQSGVEDLVALTVNEMSDFSKDAEPSDDRTILAFQIKALQASGSNLGQRED
ncbi:MAG: PP2C family protein-serine/threonine phosphatase [Planctomycetota bacterium]